MKTNEIKVSTPFKLQTRRPIAWNFVRKNEIKANDQSNVRNLPIAA